MPSTIILAAGLLGLLAVSAVLWAVFLRIGLRWIKLDASGRRIAFAAAIVFLPLQAAVSLIPFPDAPHEPAQAAILAVMQTLVAAAGQCLVVMLVFRARPPAAFKAWLPTMIPMAGMLAVVFWVFRPLLFEAYHSPTNAMAPTLLGTHWQGVCPECGQPAFSTPVDDRYATADPPMICRNFHVTPLEKAEQLGRLEHAGDRFFVAKFLAPRRWDLAVFQFPAEPSQMYVMRLVGLPGEKIELRDGAVWADGRRLTPPEHLRGLRYEAESPYPSQELWGSPQRPAVLGDDEYFVLGDFSRQSRDSRWWDEGAADHQPFAVPQSHLRGVATHIYWPPRRWRILR